MERLRRIFEIRKRFRSGNSELMMALFACVLIGLPVALFQSFSNASVKDAMDAMSAQVRDEMEHSSSEERRVQRVRPRTSVGYTMQVLLSMKEMGITPVDVEAYIAEHPGTALRRLKYMPDAMQKNVASTAAFIRKSNARIDVKTAWREASALVHYSVKYGVPTVLATAVAHTESTFDPNALSKKGASGVMQVMWRLHNDLLTAHGITGSGGTNPLADPEQSIAAGCLLLSRYLRAYGSVAGAMERYYGKGSTTYKNKIVRGIARILDHHGELY